MTRRVLPETWVFNAGLTFGGNPKWLFLYIQQFRPEIRPVWLVGAKKTARELRKKGLEAYSYLEPRGIAAQRKASVYVVDQVKEYLPPELSEAVILNLWHGVGNKIVERGPGVAMAFPNIARKWIRYNRDLRERQLFLVTSDRMKAHFQSRLKLEDEQIIEADYPVHSFLDQFSTAATQSNADSLETILGGPHEGRTAIYAPTWRDGGGGDFLGNAFPDVPRLLARLAELDLRLVIKVHPRMSASPYFLMLAKNYGSSQYLKFWDNTLDIYEYADQFDLAIVDYSSIAFDFVRRGIKEFTRYVFDSELFEGDGRGEQGYRLSTRDPALLPDQDEPGKKVYEFEALLEALGTDQRISGDEVDRLNDIYWNYRTLGSMDKIIDQTRTFSRKPRGLKTLYSFDVFDTLLSRRGITPGSVFLGVQQLIRTSGNSFPSDFSTDYLRLRRAAEKRARESQKRQFHDSGRVEITLNDVLKGLQNQFGLTVAQTELLGEWEIKLEIQSVMSKADQIEKVVELVEAGETVVLVSDMYLPEYVVRSLIEKADSRLKNIPLYLSSKVGFQKSTGKMFMFIFEDLDYDFGDWLHTGDNAHSDVKVPQSLGIQVNKVDGPSMTPQQFEIASQLQTIDGHFVASLMSIQSGTSGEIDRESFVKSYLALLLVPYVSWLLRHAQQEGIETLYFISRDGHFLKLIADEIILSQSLFIKTKYIYGSRYSWRLAAQRGGLDKTFFGPTGNFTGVDTVIDILEAGRISRSQFDEYLPEWAHLKSHLKLQKNVIQLIVARLSVSPAYRGFLQTVAEVEGELAVDYLRQEIDFQENFAFVEFWGRGTTQDCLAMLLGEAHGSRVKCVMYYARSIEADGEFSVRHDFVNTDFNPLAVEAVFANNPRSSVVGYRRSENAIVPVTSRNLTFDSTFFESCETYLREFSSSWSTIEFVDLPLLERQLFSFAGKVLLKNLKTPMFLKTLATLKYSQTMNGKAVKEYAPALSVGLALKILSGEKLNNLTHSRTMTIARSPAHFRAAYQLVHSQFSPTFKAHIRGGVRAIRKGVRGYLLR